MIFIIIAEFIHVHFLSIKFNLFYYLDENFYRHNFLRVICHLSYPKIKNKNISYH